MLEPTPIQYARADLAFVRRREVRVGVWSVAVGVFLLLGGGLLAVLMTGGVWNTYKQWHPTQDYIVSQKAQLAAMHAQNVANHARERAQLVARFSARSARGPLGPLNSASCDQVITVIESQSSRPLTPAQKATIVRELQQPGQDLVDPKLPITADKPNRSSTPPLQIFFCDPSRDNIQFRVDRVYSAADSEGAALRVATDGSIPSRSATRPTSQEALRQFDELGSRPDVIGDPFARPAPSSREQFAVALLAAGAIDSTAQFALAILLLVGAIEAFRSNARWRSRHRWYALGQFVVAAIAVILWLLLYSATKDDEYDIEAAITGVGVVLSIGTTIYPIVLLVLLSRYATRPHSVAAIAGESHPDF